MTGPVDVTVARLTARSLLGRRRALLLLLLPAALVGLCVLARVLVELDGSSEGRLDGDVGAFLLASFGLGTLVPLLGLIAGTGAVGPEIDDGSIVYILAKPLSRHTVVLTKLLVAVGVMLAFGVLAVVVAGSVLTGLPGRLVGAFALGSLVAGVAYCALFLLLAVVTRNAVVIGLLYALVWETLVGQFVPGARTLSVQQWSLAVVEAVLGDDAAAVGVDSAVSLGVGVVLLALVTVGATAYAGQRLRRLRLAGDA